MAYVTYDVYGQELHVKRSPQESADTVEWFEVVLGPVSFRMQRRELTKLICDAQEALAASGEDASV